MDEKKNSDDTARTSQPDHSETSESRAEDKRTANPQRAGDDAPHGHVADEDEERFDAG